ncbi:Calpain-type cysteine protease dek1, partial [Chytridiales sp. JEL 0842]
MSLKCPEGYDASVWDSLPLDIQQELVQSSHISSINDHPVAETPPFFVDNNDGSLTAAPRRSSVKRDFAEFALDDADYNSVLRSLGVMVEDDQHHHHHHTQNQHHDPPAFVVIPDSKQIGYGIRSTTLLLPCSAARDDGRDDASWVFTVPSKDELDTERDGTFSTKGRIKLELDSDGRWTDPEFPPNVSSLDGIKSPNNSNLTTASSHSLSIPQTTTTSHYTPKCLCGKPAKLQKAMAVVAERQDLISRIILTKEPNMESIYWVRLYIDGKWCRIPVDDYFPLRPPNDKKSGERGKGREEIGSEPLAFCKSSQRQLWACLLEKAYAKAHSSYRALHAGHISEALFDMTSFPTESIMFGSFRFDSELFWGRLLSFNENKFLMGASCPFSGQGLVGSHAYSILDVRELTSCGISVGRQARMTEFLGGGPSTMMVNGVAESMPWLTADGTIRLLKLRNPWGCKEWTGDFGVNSQVWTSSLKAAIGKDAITEEGVFWISYHDFLQRFYSVDVCFAHENWFSSTLPFQIPPSSSTPSYIFELNIFEPTWTHLSLCQPTKRGKANQAYYYSDVTLLIFRVFEKQGGDAVELED